MKLNTYLDANGIDRAAFAKQIGVSAEAVRLWICGSRAPRRQHLDAIRAATNGAVTANDFFADQSAA
jgi:DNA-binding transcriptional regulator YdaS (Cro superfamily)